jgi:hypothetical protein
MFAVTLLLLSHYLVGYNAFSVAKIFTLNDIDTYAKLCGLTLNVKPSGPFLRIEAVPIGSEECIGHLSAFIRPLPPLLFQLDTIQVENRRQTLGFQRRKEVSLDGPGISFIMGSYALRWAYDRGCRTTQLLAVKDTDEMHKVLVRLYNSFGFRLLRELDDTAASIPDRLIWGAEGSLMEMNIPSFMEVSICIYCFYAYLHKSFYFRNGLRDFEILLLKRKEESSRTNRHSRLYYFNPIINCRLSFNTWRRSF